MDLYKKLEMDGYVYIADVRYIPVFRKIVDGKGKWKAILDDKIINVTYEQALGREAIRPIDKVAMFLGKKLLPN